MGNNMNNFNIKSFMNNLNAIDTGSNNINRILNPSTRYYQGKNNLQAKPVQVSKAVNEPAVQRQSGAEAGAGIAGRSSIAGNNTAGADAAGKAGTGNMTGTSFNDRSTEPVVMSERVINTSNNSGNSFKLDFSGSSLLNGLLMSEILGKPKYLRKGRWL